MREPTHVQVRRKGKLHLLVATLGHVEPQRFPVVIPLNGIPLGIMGALEKIGPVEVPTGCVGPGIKSRGFYGLKNIPILF